MSKDLEIIEQLEKRFDIRLELVNEFKYYSTGYQLDEQQNVIALGLYECELLGFPEEITKPINLKKLCLHNLTIEPIERAKGNFLLNADDLFSLAEKWSSYHSINQLRGLTELYLSSIKDGGIRLVLFKEIRNLKNLVKLSIRNSNLWAFPYSILKSIDNLEYLDLYGNDLGDGQEESNKGLEQLNAAIYRNVFPHEHLLSSDEYISQRLIHTKLKVLDLQANGFKEFPNDIFLFPNLEELFLNGEIQSIPENIANLQRLQHLDLTGCALANFQNSISKLKNLDYLSLNHNQLTQVDKDISHLVNLKVLYLNSNQLSSFPKELCSLHNLEILDLGNNRIPTVPNEVGFLSNLVNLRLNSNQIRLLPKEIGNLIELDFLGLNQNQLTSLPEEIGNLTKLEYLSLSGNELTHLPTEVANLTRLEDLDLSGNNLTKFPIEICKLTSLKDLDLCENPIVTIPDEICFLSNLNRFLVKECSLRSIPESICELKHLKSLSLYDNQLTRLPLNLYKIQNLSSLGIRKNPLEFPPPEVVEKGIEAIFAYLKALEQPDSDRPLRELKILLVGDGGAGKTSLMKRLLGQAFNPNESQTHGINLNTLEFGSGEKAIKTHLWDFGGQEIMHATHQFFLSKRSLYVLVLDSRREQKPEYWLDHIRSFGGDSPVIVVINKIDQNSHFEVQRRQLQNRYPNISAFCRISCADNQGIDSLHTAIEGALTQMEMVQTVFPVAWLKVKNALQDAAASKHYLSYDHYVDLCREHAINGETEQRTLIDFLHDLGVVVHFHDRGLYETNVINPRWLTEAVYAVITAPRLTAQQGALKRSELATLLDSSTYPSHKHDYLLGVMQQFELCYAPVPDTLLFPELFAVEAPHFDFDTAQAVHVRIEYNFLPKSILPRLMVRLHGDIDNQLRWRHGMVLHGQNARALIEQGQNCLELYVNGTQRRDYLTLIRFFLANIHASFEQLTVTEKLSLPEKSEISVNYAHLLKLHHSGQREIFPEGADHAYLISDLLGEVQAPNLNPQHIEQLAKQIAEKMEEAKGNQLAEEFANVFDWKASLGFMEIDLIQLGKAVKALFKKGK